MDERSSAERGTARTRRRRARCVFAHVWGRAAAVLFVRGRPCFHRLDGTKAAANCGAPIALIAYGEDNARILAGCGLGVCVHWSNAPAEARAARRLGPDVGREVPHG